MARNACTRLQMEQRLAEASARIAELEAALQQYSPSASRSDPPSSPRETADFQATADHVPVDHREQLLRFMHLLGMTNVFIRDLDNRVVYWTKGARRTYGFPAEEALGRDCTKLLNIRFSEPVDRIRTTLLRTGRWEGEMTCTRRDGRTIIIASEWLLYRDSQNQPAAILEAGTDITDHKRADEQLRELNQTLERQVARRTPEAEQRASQLQRLATELTQAEQRERQRIAQVLHDDLQQLLVGARFQVHLLRSQLSAPQQQALARINELLNQSLAVSRELTSELFPPVLRDGRLPELLQYLVRWAAEKYGLAVRLTADEVLGHPDRNMRDLLFQAVREMLLNVVKHAGTRHAEIRLRDSGPGRIQLVVADLGVGFQPTATDGSDSGSGFGLFSIRERLVLLGASMDIESRPGAGTRITLTIPCPRIDHRICGCSA